MGLYGGGYEGRLSYGGGSSMNIPISRHPTLVNESRPLPEPVTTHREEMYGTTGLGMYDYGLPDSDAIHPFPEFGSATMDAPGTGGLEKPSEHGRRESFDDGNEKALADGRRRERPSKEDIPGM